jgi:membrane fusion protein (multidrug efflux system)
MTPALLSNKRRAVIAAIATFIVIAAAIAAVVISKRLHAEDKKGPVELHFVASDLTFLTARPLAARLPINGNIVARSEAVVRAKAALDVKQILVREGDTVHAGEVLAQLDTAELQARLAQKTSTRDSARATFELAEKNRTTNHELLDKKFISQNAFDSFDSTFKANHASLDAANAEVDVARIDLSQATVTAPIAGTIAKRYIKVGEKTAVDGQLFSIVDVDSLELQSLVPAAEVARLEKGMHVEVSVDGIPDQTFTGTLDRISPATEEGTRSIMTFFSVNNAGHKLRSGMYAAGEVALSTSSPRPSIPLTAVRTDAGQSVVWTVENNALTRRQVDLGLEDLANGWVEVRRGLPPNVPILASKFDDLKEGAPARAMIDAPEVGKVADAHAHA